MHRTLILSHENRGIPFDSAYDYWRENNEITLEVLDKKSQARLGSVFKKLRVETYQRVILDIPFKRSYKQNTTLQHIPNLIFYEEDACQDRIPTSKWHGKFSAFYKKIPHARVICTGRQTTQHFLNQNVDAHFIAKGFDHHKIEPLNIDRDIEAAFVGRLSSSAYVERATLINTLTNGGHIQQLRSTADGYNQLLNRIAIFVSADIGLGEYMAKNFEAMAAGCAVLAFEQGKGEEGALGLVDGKNILLYKNTKDAEEKLAMLKTNTRLRKIIAENGRNTVASSHRHIDIAENILSIAQQPFTRQAKPASLLSKLLRSVTN